MFGKRTGFRRIVTTHLIEYIQKGIKKVKFCVFLAGVMQLACCSISFIWRPSPSDAATCLIKDRYRTPFLPLQDVNRLQVIYSGTSQYSWMECFMSFYIHKRIMSIKINTFIRNVIGQLSVIKLLFDGGMKFHLL